LDKNQFDAIIERLDRLTKLIALQSVKGEVREQDKILLLSEIGFRPSEIGQLLGKSSTNISVVLSKIRKGQQPTQITPSELTEESGTQ